MAVAKGRYDNIVAKISVDTEDPTKTLEKIVDWLADKHISSLGVAAFGPLCLNPLDPK